MLFVHSAGLQQKQNLLSRGEKMKITKLPELSHVKDLLALYPAILLRVHSKSHALSARAEYDIPEDGVEMRYEFDIDKLYITRTFFTSRDSLDILKSLQGYLTYVGSCSMRITRGKIGRAHV